MSRMFVYLAGLLSAVMLAVSIVTPLRAEAVSKDEAKEIAADAYLYAYPMLYNYKTLFQQAVDPSFPGYVGGFNRFRHYSRGFTPADKESSHPATICPTHGPGLTFGRSRWWSLFRYPRTVITSSSGSSLHAQFRLSRLTSDRHRRGQLPFVGPNWTGETPDGITKVLHAETEFIGTLTRTSWSGPADRDGLAAMQQQYRIRPRASSREESHRRRRQTFCFRRGTRRAPTPSVSSTI